MCEKNGEETCVAAGVEEESVYQSNRWLSFWDHFTGKKTMQTYRNIYNVNPHLLQNTWNITKTQEWLSLLVPLITGRTINLSLLEKRKI